MIKIITTGGTIEGLDYIDDSNRSNENPQLIKDFLEVSNVSFHFSIENAFSKDSRFITIKDLELLVKKIKSSKEEKILITHGTKTMADTARYLGKLELDKTIVLVGSFILGTERNTDATFNLGYAVCALQTLSNGTYIAMNGKTFPWESVIKNERDNRFEEFKL